MGRNPPTHSQAGAALVQHGMIALLSSTLDSALGGLSLTAKEGNDVVRSQLAEGLRALRLTASEGREGTDSGTAESGDCNGKEAGGEGIEGAIRRWASLQAIRQEKEGGKGAGAANPASNVEVGPLRVFLGFKVLYMLYYYDRCKSRSHNTYLMYQRPLLCPRSPSMVSPICIHIG